MYTYLHVTTIMEKRAHAHDKEQRGLYGRGWMEEQEGGKEVIIII